MMVRALAGAAAFVAAAAAGVVAALVASRPSLGLWVALGTVVIVGAALQGALSVGERRSKRSAWASGDGSVVIDGNAVSITTHVRGGEAASSSPVGGDDGSVMASGRGSVSVGGDAAGPVVTDVEDGAGS